MLLLVHGPLCVVFEVKGARPAPVPEFGCDTARSNAIVRLELHEIGHVDVATFALKKKIRKSEARIVGSELFVPHAMFLSQV